MPIEIGQGDLARAVQHEPDMTWPTSLKIELTWWDGTSNRVRTRIISADEFFGVGNFGAPMQGANIVGMIENMRREGPPPPLRKTPPKPKPGKLINPRRKNGPAKKR